MTLNDWPLAHRPRERLLDSGAEALTDAELLAILLASGPRGSNVVAHAQALLNQCHGLRGLLDRPMADLLALPGIGPARATTLKAALALGERHLLADLKRGDCLDAPSRAGELMTRWLRGAHRERFGVLFLDNRHRVIAQEVLFEGSIDSATVHPRIVVQRAMQLNAAAVVLGHNHPSGIAEPSNADRAVTACIKQALGLVDVRLLDHFVVGDGPAVSMAALGWV